LFSNPQIVETKMLLKDERKIKRNAESVMISITNKNKGWGLLEFKLLLDGQEFKLIEFKIYLTITN